MRVVGRQPESVPWVRFIPEEEDQHRLKLVMILHDPSTGGYTVIKEKPGPRVIRCLI